MIKHRLRGLLLLIGLLTLFAVAASPAYATLTGGPISARATGTTFNASDGSRLTGDSEATCTVDADQIRITCRTISFTNVVGTRGLSVPMTCTTGLDASFISIASIRNTSADADLDITDRVTCRDAFGFVTVVVQGPQRIRNAARFSQATQTLAVDARRIAATINGAAVTADFRASYRISTGRITIS